MELAASAGRILEPWQSDEMDAMLSVRPSGKWNCYEFGQILGRQNGKGEPLETRALVGLFLLEEPLIVWSAHQTKTAFEAFRRIEATIRGCFALRKRVKRFIHSNGDEGIELISGERLRFVARSSGSGRGFAAPTVIVDEAYAYTGDQQAALAPLLLAQDNPQVIYASTPPLDSATGFPLFALKARAVAGGDPDLGWVEWSNPKPEEGWPSAEAKREWSLDVANWARSNPALGHGRVTAEGIGRLAKSMLLDDFCREVLCLWPPEPATAAELDMKRWGDLADRESRRQGAVAFALDITPDRSWSTIAAYGLREDGLGHLEVVAHRAGTDWCVPRLAELRERHNPVGIALDVKGPAGNLLLELADAGIRVPADDKKPGFGDLAIPVYQDVAAACGGFIDAMNQSTVRHLDQAPLSMALQMAKTRPLGDAKAWARRGAQVPISPLVAVSLAKWCYESRVALVSKVYDPLANIF